MGDQMTEAQLLAQQADAAPPITPRGLALAMIAVMWLLGLMNLAIITARIWTKGWMLRSRGLWGLEDTLMVLGYVPFVPAVYFAIKGGYFGFGTPDADLTPFQQMRAAEYLIWWQVSFVLTIPLVKSSIAIQIMRLFNARRYRYPLWFVIWSSTLNAVAGLAAVLSHCAPVEANWNPQAGTCGSLVPLVQLSYAFTAVAVTSDLICALAPIFLVRQLNLPPREKWAVSGILGVGIIASAFTIVRVPFLKQYLTPEDQLYYHGYMVTCSMLEEGLGIFAGSLPCLRRLLNAFRSPRPRIRVVERAGAEYTIGGTPLDSMDPDSRERSLSYASLQKSRWGSSADGEDEFHSSRGRNARVDEGYEDGDNDDCDGAKGYYQYRDDDEEETWPPSAHRDGLSGGSSRQGSLS